ncbi:anterior gradient 1 [Genypterus blacodes]|uniref:anterior gradient 1 n=1 Tax=Genypterus blacodes TaxID=154954 RepID=UPI003F76EBA9
MMSCWPLFLLLLVVWPSGATEKKKTKAKAKDISGGWGNNITWMASYEAGLSKMSKSNKPLMVIFHTEDCPYSQELKKAFVAHKTIQKMAQQNFVMLNLETEVIDENMAPDGHYVPRILFVDPSLTVRADITGKYDNRLYTYKPKDLLLLATNMKRAKLTLHSEL